MEGSVGGSSLYDEDVYAWAEQQAAVLRGLAARRDLPNELDLANVIEEIEDVGRGELSTVRILLGDILTQLVSAWADPTNEDPCAWGGKVVGWLSDVGRRITPSMRGVIDLEELWCDAIHLAAATLDIHGRDVARERSNSLASATCPYSLDDPCSRPFNVRGLLEKLPVPHAPSPV
jgi:hypothetical protein